MKLQDKFKLGSWLSRNTDKDFHWGVWDCNIFFVEYHDIMYNTDDLKRIQNKYFDKRSGIRLLRDMKLTSGQWLTLRNYKKSPTKKPKWKDGDIALQEHRLYASVFIYFDGAFWSVTENSTLKGYTPKAVETAMTSWWRKDG